ncbi:MAG: ATP-dependent helicase [Bacteroidetes bacterium]|nr:MAG: ATP-dependent helicase [Bacteroidota bacterium]
MNFKELGIIDVLLEAIKDEGYTNPTPIQIQAIPTLLEGNDLLGCAQTGTGKTAAFGVPILQNLYNKHAGNVGRRKIRALIVTPTRELAIQIGESFTAYGKYTGLNNTVIFGGVKQGSQTNALRSGVDILVATPGRLLDLMNQGFVSLKDIEYFVLDEADRMLDMGFIHDIKKIIAKLPQKRQSLFFSATMAPEIVKLSHKILGHHPKKVTVNPEQTTAELVKQTVYFVNKQSKPKLLVHLLNEGSYYSVLVFSRTKYGADKIVRWLTKAGIGAAAIHGNKSQNARQRALGSFKDGKIHVLVATDIAARGIDIDHLSLVINFDLPNIPESYVHRIGRTGRAESSGIAISFCNAEEQAFLKDIQKLINKKIEVVKEHPFTEGSQDAAPKSKKPPPRRKKHATHKNVKEGVGNKNWKRHRSGSSKRRY